MAGAPASRTTLSLLAITSSLVTFTSLSYILFRQGGVHFHSVFSGTESEDNNVVFLKGSGFEGIEFEGLSASGDSGAVGGVEVYQHKGELWGEVDAGVCLTDGVVVQLVLVVLVTSEEELALLFQEQLVNRLLILYYDQGDDSPQLLVPLHSLITNPPVPITTISHLVTQPHQDLSKCVVALPLHYSPVLLHLSAFLEAVYQSSGMCLC